MIKVKRKDLCDALEKVKPGLANKEVIEQSTSFAFVDGRVITYNDEISVSHPIPGLEGITGAIRAEELYKFLAKTTSEDIELESDPDSRSVQVKAGRAKVGLSIQENITITSYLPLNEVKSSVRWKSIPKGLIEAIAQVTFSCSKDMSTQLYTCVHICEDGIVESCDHVRATRFKVDKIPVPTFLIPQTSAEDLVKYPITKIYKSEGKTSGAWVHFKTDDDTVFSCRCYNDETYDSLDTFLNKKEKKKGTIALPEKLKEIIERAMIFARQEHQYDEIVELQVDAKKITVKAKGNSGWFEEWARIKDYEGEPFSFFVCPRFFLGTINLSQVCSVTRSQVILEGENWKHAIGLFVKEEK